MSQKRIEELRTFIRDGNKAYYGDDNPTVSDAVYDSWCDELRLMSSKDEVFKEIGSLNENSTWPKVEHTIPMGSQTKVNLFSELEDWSGKQAIKSYSVQQKLDGISIALYYLKGKLVYAVTRGRSAPGDPVQKGENIVPNVRKMKGVPQQIKTDEEVFAVRGEIILPNSIFKKKYIKLGKKTARNTASGIAKRYDGVGCDDLMVVVYDAHGETYTTETAKIAKLKKFGFKVVDTVFCTTLAEVEEVYQEYLSGKRDALEWDIDGLVVKSDDIFYNDDEKHPKKQRAYKFPSPSGRSILRSIDHQHSGGRTTPVANIDPIIIMGSEIKRFTLSNYDLITRLDLAIGDHVEVSKAGDVIPHIEAVVERPDDRVAIISPEGSDCPHCGVTIVREMKTSGEPSAYIRCPNYSCPMKAVRIIMSWIRVHDAKGVGDSLVNALYDKGIFTGLVGFIFFSSKENADEQRQALSIDGVGSSKLKTLRRVIKPTMKTTLLRALLGIDLSGFGPGRLRDIISTCAANRNGKLSLQDVMELDEAEVRTVPKLKKMAKVFISEIKIATPILAELRSAGVEIEDFKAPSGVNALLAGKSFCFTGTLHNMPRKKIETLVRDLGGTVSSVKKGLTALVTNDPDGSSSKNKKAEELGIEKMTEDDFLKFVGVAVTVG